jgi:hypothetical protein
VKITVKLDESDSKRVTEGAAQLAALANRVSLTSVMSFIDDIAAAWLSNEPGTTAKDDGDGADEADEQRQGRETLIKPWGIIRPGDISAEALNRLNEVGIETLVELADYSEAQLWRFSHLRESDIVEYKALLATQDMTLRGEEA